MKSSSILKYGVLLICLLGALGGGVYLYHSTQAIDHLDIPESGGFSGIVVNGETNNPLSDVTLSAYTLDDHQEIAHTVSDEDGRFSFELDDGKYGIHPTLDTYITRGKNDVDREITIQNSTQFVNAKLKLWPAASIKGKVVAGNIGIQSQIKVAYTKDASGAAPYEFISLQTQKDGTFEVNNAYAGVVTVSIASDGFASIDLTEIILKAGQDIDLGDIPLRDGVSLYGQITDSTTKRGISGATISIKDLEGNLLERATTNSDGHYRLAALENMRVKMDVSATGYHDFSNTMQLKGNTNREISLSLKRAWGLVLDVQNQTGRDPLSTSIVITDVLTNKVVYSETLANGVYSLDSLKGGPFLVEASSHDLETTQTMRAVAGQEARIRLKPFGYVQLKVYESDGSPLNEGQYRYSYRPFEADDSSYKAWAAITSSQFDIPDLREGYYTVEIRKDKSQKEVSSPEFEIRHGDVRPLKLQLTEGGVLKGHVVSTVEGFNIQASITIEKDSRSTQTDVDGNFVLDKFPTEPVTLIIKPNREEQETRFEGIVIPENSTVEREFRVNAPKQERRQKRRNQFMEMRENGELPTPPWGDGPPPWGDGPPPWQNGDMPTPPWGDGPPPWQNGDMPTPPWGDGPPPWQNGNMPTPPWGDGPPPWQNGDMPSPPWGNGAPSWQNGETTSPPQMPQPSGNSPKTPSPPPQNRD